MNSKRIKKVFSRFFGMPNPIFCYPVLYFQHKQFLCEVARSKQLSQCRWDNNPYSNKNPLWILDGLFCVDGFFITVLERTSSGIEHRVDLGTHINKGSEITSFINRYLN